MTLGDLCDLNKQPRRARVLYVCYPAGKNEVSVRCIGQKKTLVESGYMVKYDLSLLISLGVRPALGKSLGLRPYFTVYPSSRPNTDTVQCQGADLSEHHVRCTV